MEWTCTLTIDSGDRLTNKYTPVNDDDPNEMNVRWIMRIADKIVDGQYRFRVPRYSTAARPASPALGEVILNTDSGQFEGWNGEIWVTLG